MGKKSKRREELHWKKDIGKGSLWRRRRNTVQSYAGGECGPWNIYETSGQFFNKANLLSLILCVSVCMKEDYSFCVQYIHVVIVDDDDDDVDDV